MHVQYTVVVEVAVAVVVVVVVLVVGGGGGGGVVGTHTDGTMQIELSSFPFLHIFMCVSSSNWPQLCKLIHAHSHCTIPIYGFNVYMFSVKYLFHFASVVFFSRIKTPLTVLNSTLQSMVPSVFFFFTSSN